MRQASGYTRGEFSKTLLSEEASCELHDLIPFMQNTYKHSTHFLWVHKEQQTQRKGPTKFVSNEPKATTSGEGPGLAKQRGLEES